MIFRRSYSFNANLSKSEIRKKLIGQHFQVHKLDFEVMDKGGVMKVIPHTELAEDKVYTLPITHILINETNGKTKVKVKCKPRRIDIGGPTIALFFILFTTAAGYILYRTEMAEYETASLAMMGFGALMLIFFGIRMNQGYFDYIRKIKRWIKKNI